MISTKAFHDISLHVDVIEIRILAEKVPMVIALSQNEHFRNVGA